MTLGAALVDARRGRYDTQSVKNLNPRTVQRRRKKKKKKPLQAGKSSPAAIFETRRRPVRPKNHPEEQHGKLPKASPPTPRMQSIPIVAQTPRYSAVAGSLAHHSTNPPVRVVGGCAPTPRVSDRSPRRLYGRRNCSSAPTGSSADADDPAERFKAPSSQIPPPPRLQRHPWSRPQR